MRGVDSFGKLAGRFRGDWLREVSLPLREACRGVSFKVVSFRIEVPG